MPSWVPVESQGFIIVTALTSLWLICGWAALPPSWPGSTTTTIPASGLPFGGAGARAGVGGAAAVAVPGEEVAGVGGLGDGVGVAVTHADAADPLAEATPVGEAELG